MKVCILSQDSDVEKCRVAAKAITEADTFKVPVSHTGQLPATHWFCVLESTDVGYQKLLDLQKVSVIEVSGPKSFLAKWNLKAIR